MNPPSFLPGGLLASALLFGAGLSVAQAQLNYTPYAITTLAGSAGFTGSTNATGAAARFDLPYGVAVDASGNLYVTDGSNHAVRAISPLGVVTTFATSVNSGTGSGTLFGVVGGIAIDGSGNLYVTDITSGALYKITTPGGAVTLMVPSGTFSVPWGVAVDGAGNVYVADSGNSVIRKVSPLGVVSTLAGSLGNSGIVNGTGSAAQFDFPVGVAVDASGNVYVTDAPGDIIRLVTAAGVVTTYAGQVTNPGTVDGNLASALFTRPAGIAIDSAGNLYLTDSGHMVRKISPTGTVTSLAGSVLEPGSSDGTGNSALFSFASPPAPSGIALDASGNLYIADTDNNTVRKGTVSSALPPQITTQPQSETVVAGTSATLSVVVSGTGPFNYQWNAGGTAIAGATASSYTINNVQPGNAGNYQVIVVGAGGTIFSNDATLTVSTSPVAPAITSQPQSQTVTVGASVTFTVAASGTAPLSYQWSFNGGAISGATASSYTLANAQASNAGSYTVTVTNSAGSVSSSAAALTVSSAPGISTQPQSVTALDGSNTTLSVAASGSGLSYQWYYNGAPISGATSASLALNGLTTIQGGGSYYVVVTNGGGSATSNTVTVGVATTSRLVNLSILSNIQSSLSMGFVTGGAGTSGSQNLLIRAVGPSIGPGTAFNVPNVMPDPTLTVVQQSNHATVASDAGWGTPAANATAVQSADAATGAFALTNTASLDSALVANLPESTGGYSAVVAGKSGDSGNAITEVYDDTPALSYTPGLTPRLVNLSCLTQVAAGGSLSVGFVVGPSGTSSETVLIRAIGPGLSAFGISGSIPDPQLVVSPLGNAGNILATNAGWGANATAVDSAESLTGAFTLSNPASKDSAVVLTLAPGGYTAQVSSATGAGGPILVEIYEVP